MPKEAVNPWEAHGRAGSWQDSCTCAERSYTKQVCRQDLCPCGDLLWSRLCLKEQPCLWALFNILIPDYLALRPLLFSLFRLCLKEQPLHKEPRAGAACEVHPVRRSHAEEGHGALSPVRGTPRWNREEHEEPCPWRSSRDSLWWAGHSPHPCPPALLQGRREGTGEWGQARGEGRGGGKSFLWFGFISHCSD